MSYLTGHGVFLFRSLFVATILFSPFFAFAKGEATVIHITQSGFEPTAVNISVGDAVTFQNDDQDVHWPASNIHPTHTVYPGSGIEKCRTPEEKNIFDACRDLQSGESYTFTFTQAGSWRYHDHSHPELGGTVVVSGISEKSGERRSVGEMIVNAFMSTRRGVMALYYHFFPKSIEEKLARADIFALAKNEAELRDMLSIAGAEKVMDKLLMVAGETNRDCHQEAHQIGRIAYQLYGAEVFKEGDASCHSGFYHGAMEAFLSKEGTANLSEKIEKICSIFDTKFGTFECIHGVGHGVMAYTNYDLPAALDICKELDPDKSRWCWGGVFMENIVAGKGQGALPGHETAWLSDDPHYPCNGVSQDYNVQYECYQMQTSWILQKNGYDVPGAAKECMNARKDMIPVCFISLGRDIAGITIRDPIRMKELCAYAPREGGLYNQCILGALHVVVDYWGPKLQNQASDFCAILDPETKLVCDSSLAQKLKEYFTPTTSQNGV